MENFSQIFTLLAEEEGIRLNLDIFETGLLNILALLAILIYSGNQFIGSLLEERKTTIVKGIQDAEDRLNEAEKRLKEAKKQLSQIDLVVREIENETRRTKKLLFESEFFEAKNELNNRIERTIAAYRSKICQLVIESKDYLLNAALYATLRRAKKKLKNQGNKRRVINNIINHIDTIKALEGEIL